MKKIAFILSVVLLIGACTTMHKVSKVSHPKIEKVLLSVGLRSKHESAEFSCDSYFQPYAKNFIEPLFSKTLKCLNSIQEGSATYTYMFEPSLHLAFRKADEGAQCMKEIFPTLSVPKELYFVGQSDVRSEWECYAVNMDTEANIVADVTLPWDRFKLEMRFPLSRELKNQSDLQIWLMVNLLQSIQAEMGGELRGSMVPESLCKRCYSDTPWFDDKRKDKIPPVYWP